jgi:predicted RNase H-like nuclease (RuvC/YqgF family)
MIAVDQHRPPESQNRRGLSKGHARRLAKCRRRLHRERRALAQRVAQLRQAWHALAKRRRGLEQLEKQIAHLEP